MKRVSSNRLVVFSKSADHGLVKTRMRPVLDDDDCMALHLALLDATLQKTKGMNRVLYLSGSGYLPMSLDLPVRNQTGSDLGQRMFQAFQHELQEAGTVVIIGTDSPTISAETILQAFDLLNKNDAVFGPAKDGGYYLIGLSKFIPEIFENISWGSSSVLQQTLGSIGNHSYQLLESCFDVDTPDDLKRLEEQMPDFPHIGYLAAKARRSG